jgi:hypothetical protein
VRRVWLNILATGLAAGCSVSPPPIPVYEGPGLAVQLRYDPKAGPGHSHPAVVPPEHIAETLRGLRLYGRDVLGTFGALGDHQGSPAFGEREASFLAPHLAAGLAKASTRDLVTFHLVQRDNQGAPLVTSGGVFVRGRHFYIILANARTSPSSIQYETTYEPNSRTNPLLPIARFKYAAGYEPADQRIPTSDAKRVDGWEGYLDESKVVVVDLEGLGGRAVRR